MLIGFVLLGLSFGQSSGAVASNFQQRYRYTGAALTSDLAWLFGAGFAPLVALLLATNLGVIASGAYLLSGAFCTLIALWLSGQREVGDMDAGDRRTDGNKAQPGRSCLHAANRRSTNVRSNSAVLPRSHDKPGSRDRSRFASVRSRPSPAPPATPRAARRSTRAAPIVTHHRERCRPDAQGRGRSQGGQRSRL